MIWDRTDRPPVRCRISCVVIAENGSNILRYFCAQGAPVDMVLFMELIGVGSKEKGLGPCLAAPLNMSIINIIAIFRCQAFVLTQTATHKKSPRTDGCLDAGSLDTW